MSKVVNIVGTGSNVGKTRLIEGLIKELVSRNLSVGTIKHDVHGFDIDKEGKDTYIHRKAGAETVVISSKERLAIIKELEEETPLEELLKLINNKDIVLVEGYKKSSLRKIEVYREGYSDKIISPKEILIAIASDTNINYHNVEIIHKEDFKRMADLIEEEKEYIYI